MKAALLALLIATGAAAGTLKGATAADQPDFKAPPGAIPYGTKLCRTEKGIHAFAFVRSRARFDKEGCTHPMKAWTYSDRLGRWMPTQADEVTCCDPAEKAGTGD